MFVWGLMLSVLSMAGAADEAKGKGKKKEATLGGQQVFQHPQEITLTEDQQAKLNPLKEQHSAKLAELAKKLDESVTDEQKKAGTLAIVGFNVVNEDGCRDVAHSEHGLGPTGVASWHVVVLFGGRWRR